MQRCGCSLVSMHMEPTSVALEHHSCASVRRWNPPVWRWNLTAAQARGAGTGPCGAGTSHLRRRGALEPTSVALERQTCTGVRRWNLTPFGALKV